MLTETEKHSLAWFILTGVFDWVLRWRLSSALNHTQKDIGNTVALGSSWIPKNQQQVYDALRL